METYKYGGKNVVKMLDPKPKDVEMISVELNLKNIIAESREAAQALNEFADDLERIENKYAEPQEVEEEE